MIADEDLEKNLTEAEMKNLTDKQPKQPRASWGSRQRAAWKGSKPGSARTLGELEPSEKKVKAKRSSTPSLNMPSLLESGTGPMAKKKSFWEGVKGSEDISQHAKKKDKKKLTRNSSSYGRSALSSGHNGVERARKLVHSLRERRNRKLVSSHEMHRDFW
jgi:hypothetical protein